MAREETESDAFGDDQSDATPEVASLDMPLDSENEADAKDDDVKAIEEVVETSKTIEEAEMRGTIGSVKYVAQLETSSRNGTNAPDNQLEERTMKCDNGASRNETAAETPTDDLFCEFEFPPLTREKKTPRKPSISGWKKPMTKKLKWKRVPSDELLFNLSLLPRRDGAALAPRTDCDATRDVQEELKKLEEELWVIEDAKAAEAEEETGKENVECMVDDNALWTNFVEEEDFEDDVDLAFYEDKVSPQVLTSLEHFRDNRASKRLRRKLKWRHQKAHRAVKTKHWNLKNMVNKPHGRKLYIHHRLHVSVSFSPHYLPTPHHLKRTVIDSKGFEIVKKSKGRTEKKFNNVKCNSRAFRAAGREHPIAQPVPAYALRANNADGALDNDLVNVLINLQNRDLTPEDYELLLRLDERVAPQTVTQDVLDGFRTDVASESDTHQECAVCMETYQVGQGRKHLPCGHVFHAHCIDTWLSNSSLNCPLDGLSVECC